MRPSARFRHVAACMAGLALTAAASTRAQTPPGPQAPAAALPADFFTGPEFVMGDPKARVTVVEYASASCPHCARFDIEVFPAFKKKYVDTGKVRFIFREFLTDPVQVAAAGFLLARCAGKDKYYTVLDDYFHGQEEIYRTGQLKTVILRIAKSAGLSEPQVDACLNDKAAIDALNARIEDAETRQKIDHTPTFLIDGKEFKGDPGREIDLAQLDTGLQPLLEHPAGRR